MPKIDIQKDDRKKATKKTVEANRKYNEKHYDRLQLTLAKGDKAIVKKHVSEHYPEHSINSFIQLLLNKEIPEVKISNRKYRKRG